MLKRSEGWDKNKGRMWKEGSKEEGRMRERMIKRMTEGRGKDEWMREGCRKMEGKKRKV